MTTEGQETAAMAPLTAGEVRGFVARLSTYRETLSERDQMLLDALVMVACQDPTEVQGYDSGNPTWIYPPGLVDDFTWVRLSRECRVRGGIEQVLDPNNPTGVRLWGCRAP